MADPNAQDNVKKLIAAGKGAEVEQLLKDASQRARAKYESIAKDEHLNDDGRRYQLAVGYRQSRQTVDKKLAEMASTVVRIDRDDAERVFGTKGLSGDHASLTISRRDAQDRVAAITSADELRALLRRATRSGDEILARAVAEKAIENLDAKTMHEFVATRPDLDAAAERLWNAQRANSNTLGFSMLFADLRPHELGDMTSDAIEALAATEPVTATAEPAFSNHGPGAYWAGGGEFG